jgi:hypothetical protein
MICLDYLSNEIQMSHHYIYSDYVPLWDRLPVLHFSLGGSHSFFCHLSDPTLKANGRNFYETKCKENISKNTKKNANPISSKKKGHYNGSKMDFPKIT